MKAGLWKMVLGVAILAAAANPSKVHGQDPKIITFDVPGAGHTPSSSSSCGNGLLTGCYGTTPMANNNAGEIVGMYITDNGVYYGFLRWPDGKVESFTAPGADTTAGDFNGTYPMSINSSGAVVGLYQGTDEVLHGFLREPNGKYVEIDDPFAATSGGQGTWPSTINDKGEIAGFFIDSSNNYNAFIRDKDGDFTTVNDPNGSGGTIVALEQGLNARGVVGGWYYAGTSQYGFVRKPDGTFLTVEPSSTAPYTFVGGINCSGAVTGYILEANGYLSGYLQKADERPTIFHVSGPDGVLGTAAFTLNARDEITGIAVDANGENHGFVRFADGRTKTFDAAKTGTGNFQGTRPATINDAGQIIGYVLDANNVSHGFIRCPDPKVVSRN